MDQETPPFDNGTAVILSNDHTTIDCGLTPLQPQMPYEGRLTSPQPLHFSQKPQHIQNPDTLSAMAENISPHKRVSKTPALLPGLNMAAKLPSNEYHAHWPLRLKAFKAALNANLARGRSIIVIIEGWDAGGKSGTVRRIFGDLPADICTIRHAIAPTDEEKAHHFLWRFKQGLPGPGKILVQDRSWYGRVLVERAEELTPPKAWRKSYKAINAFEKDLHLGGTDIYKFWLHIDAAEHTKRLHKRIYHAEKRHKLSINDLKNHTLRGAYEAAAEDMFALTSTPHSPWHLVPANDKKYGRMKVLTTLTNALQKKSKEPPHGTA